MHVRWIIRAFVFILYVVTPASLVLSSVSLAVFFSFQWNLFFLVVRLCCIREQTFIQPYLFSTTEYYLFIYDFEFASTFVIQKYFIITLPFVSLLLLQSH